MAFAMNKDWHFHSDWEAVISELHARPTLAITGNERIIHLGVNCSVEEMATVFAKLEPKESKRPVRHAIGLIDQIRVKVERHTEFLSLTLYSDESDGDDRFQSVLMQLLPPRKVEIFLLVRIILCRTAKQLAACHPFGQRIYGGLLRETLTVQSTLGADENGCVTYAVHPKQHSPEELGRRVQRLLDMETYRMMCLLGLPVARRTGQVLGELEHKVEAVIADMNARPDGNDEDLYNRMSDLSQDINALREETRFRYSASRAYYDLMLQRLESLEEQKLGDLQTITGFVRSRVDPGMATVESMSKRQTSLSADLASALALLRTRIDLGLNKDNQALLKSMDARHRQQVLIAQTVEGLSTVAITYYALGLLAYVIKGNEHWLPFGIKASTAVAIAVPIVLLSVWATLHRMRAKWEKEEG